MSKTEKNAAELLCLMSFVSENSAGGNLPKELAEKIKELVEKYKLSTFDKDCTIIEADFGNLGSIIIREILEIPSHEEQNKVLNYKPGSYDYISIKIKSENRILWTDYKNIEPYNRQSGLYCGGMSFEMLGEPVIETPFYREFNSKHECHGYNLSFAIYGFDYNAFYGCVKFGLSIKTEFVDEFITQLRILLAKPTSIKETKIIIAKD